MKIYIISCCIFFCVHGASATTDCQALANDGDCSFYSQCVENKIPCGINGYALSYGDKFCELLTAEQLDKGGCFDSKASTWANNVNSCLIKKITSSNLWLNSSSTTTCSSLADFAIDSHSNCFASYGFCNDVLLSLNNMECLIDEVYKDKDHYTKQAINQQYEASEQCTSSAILQFEQNVDGWIANNMLSKTLEYHLNSIKDIFDGCSTPIDFLIIMDASGSVGSANFKTMKSFIENLVNNFEITGPGASQIGIIRFSSSVDYLVTLGSITDPNLLQTEIANIQFTSGGTQTDLALDKAYSIFQDGARSSSGIPSVVLLLTDGVSNNRSQTIESAKKLHSENVQVYSFGIGFSDDAELQAIASDPKYVFYINSFDTSLFNSILLQVQTSACKTPSIASVNQTINTTLSKDQYQYLEYDFPVSTGITVNIDVQAGDIIVYVSFTIQNPNPLTADIEWSPSTEPNYFISPDDYQSAVATTTSTTSNNQSVHDLYVSMVGLDDNNQFSLKTNEGGTDDAESGGSTAVLHSMTAVVMVITLLIMPTL